MSPNAVQPSPVIVTRDLVKDFGSERAVDGVSLNIYPGETLALIGSSGSGKTTILKSLNGLIPRTSGEIEIFGKSIDAWELVNLRRKMGYVIQEVGLFPHYTIGENISLIPELLGWGRHEIGRRVGELLEKVRLDPYLKDKFPDMLSGGQQQRVGLARAIAADPEVVLMDEPFGALDPIIRSGMQVEFKRMEGLAGKTIILVTHDMDEAAVLADRICLLDKGRIQQTGTLRDLLFKPANSFVRQFLDHNRDSLEWRAIRIGDVEEFLPESISIPDRMLPLIDIPEKFRDEVRKIYYINHREIIEKLLMR